MEVKANDAEANKPLCEHLGATLAGDGCAKLRCEVVRGERAPVKVVRVFCDGLAAAAAYQRLSIAQLAAEREAAAAAPPRSVGRPTF
mmetsp:Transcript_42010/g.139639  ORF Transcript_42010/g.139639 Transcript_42010/m.139639 type:complete len:87 (+) Transcript_42010:165-425(+)